MMRQLLVKAQKTGAHSPGRPNALALLVGCALALGSGFVRELKKRFHTN